MLGVKIRININRYINLFLATTTECYDCTTTSKYIFIFIYVGLFTELKYEIHRNILSINSFSFILQLQCHNQSNLVINDILIILSSSFIISCHSNKQLCNIRSKNVVISTSPFLPETPRMIYEPSGSGVSVSGDGNVRVLLVVTHRGGHFSQPPTLARARLQCVSAPGERSSVEQ